MPTSQRIGLDDRECVTPVEESGEMGERKPGGVGTTPRPDVALDIEAELFTQKEVFGGDGDGRAKQKMHELQYVGRQGKGGTNDWEKR